jgi:PAS domain S-box-containing protein
MPIPSSIVAAGKRITGLVAIMMVAVCVSTATAIALLYRTAFEQQKAYLMQSVHDQAKLIETVARFDAAEHVGTPGGAVAHTLSEIKAAFDHYPNFGQLAEIAVARRQGDELVYLIRHGRSSLRRPEAVRFSSPLAEAMRRAVSGESGSMIGLDYRGVTVLAAYEPIPPLGVGLVAKVDLADIRAPFIRAGAAVLGLALVLVTAGAVLFHRLTNPLIRHLGETEQRYERLFNSAPVPMWEQDFSRVSRALDDLKCSGIEDIGRHLAQHREKVRPLMDKVVVNDINAAALRQFGAPSARQLTEWIAQSLIHADPELARAQLQAIAQGREALLSRTVVTRTLDGREFSVNMSVLIPHAEDGYGTVAVSALDVTSAVQLRRREEELRLILASTGEGIFGMDTKGRCTFVNRVALKMLGYRREQDLLGQDMHTRIHHTCRDGRLSPSEDCPVYRSCHEKDAVLLEDELLWRADGTSFPADYRSYPMVRDGVVLGTVVTFTDITERKEREAQLLQARKMEVVGQLTGGVAHDFNNLLAVILTNLHLLEERLGESQDPDIPEMLGDAASAASDGAALIRRLLAFSRKQPLAPQWMDLDLFIDHTSRFLRRLTGEGIELVVRRPGTPLPVRVDRQQVENALLNLTINARDAMPKGGTLTIDARRQSVDASEAAADDGLSPGAYVVVSVSDTGIGMSPEVARRALEPFYSTKPMGKGSGLGLSSTLGFARQSGGGLTVSSAPGKGTTVSLFLPEAESVPADEAAEPKTPDTLQAGVKVLVVDDEARVRKLARRNLSSLGYHVLEAQNAAAAMGVLEGDPDVSLLLTDLVMPGEMDGRALARWARARYPTLRILLTTGFDREARALEAADEPSPPLLPKPYSKDQLRQAVLAALSETQSPAHAEDA